jgi:hypothetical protein
MQTPETLAAHLAAQDARLAALEQTNQELQAALQQAREARGGEGRHQPQRAWRQRWGWGTVLLVAACTVGLAPRGPVQAGTTLQQRVDQLEAQVAALQLKLERVSVQTIDGYYSLVIEGANLHLRSGLGATDGNPSVSMPMEAPEPADATNGLGNLIVGYNEPTGARDGRIGSHNVVVGESNDFSSFGGLVVGVYNTISAQFASVSGGAGNTASGERSSVSGGANNQATGFHSAVSGGGGNQATGGHCSVSGGFGNIASNGGASVSGGESNQATQLASWVGGGKDNLARGQYSSVSGGRSNQAFAAVASVSGGEGNWASGQVSSVSGGRWNVAHGHYSSVSGGRSGYTPEVDDWRAGGLFQED